MATRQRKVTQSTSESEGSSSMTTEEMEYDAVLRKWYDKAGSGKRLQQLAHALHTWALAVIVAGSGEEAKRDVLSTFERQLRFLKERRQK